MRLWTIHPRYLDAKGLTAAWREGLLAQAVLRGQTIGYRNHPQLERFRRQRVPVRFIRAYLAAVLSEADARGYAFDRSKLRGAQSSSKITTTRGQLLYEFEHLKRKLRARDPLRYRSLAGVKRPAPHPMFRIVAGPVHNWEKLKTKIDRQDAKAARKNESD